MIRRVERLVSGCAARHRLAIPVAVAALVAGGCLLRIVDPLAPTLEGSVRSGIAGEPVQGVEIALPDYEIATITDVDGRFRIPEVPRGELDVWIGAATKSSVTLRALKFSGKHELLVSLDADGGVDLLEVRASASALEAADVYHALARPAGAPNLESRAFIQGELFSNGDEELAIELDRMEPGSVHEVYSAESSTAGARLTYLGSVVAEKDGYAEFRFENYDRGNGRQINQLLGNKVQVRPQGRVDVQFSGRVPKSGNNGRRKGEAPLMRTAAGPVDAGGIIKVKSSPPGKNNPDMDSIEFAVRGLDSKARYQVCVDCSGVDPSKSTTVNNSPAGRSNQDRLRRPYTSLSDRGPVAPRGAPPHIAANGTVAIGEPVFTSGEGIDVPILVTPTETLVGAKFTIEYNGACLEFIGARKGSALENVASADDPPQAAAAAGATAPNDMHVTVLETVSGPTESFGSGSDLEIVVLEFTRKPAGTCRLVWDTEGTTLTTSAGIEGTPDGFSPQPPEGVLVPTPLTCIETLLTTDHKGVGRLRIRQLKGDALPCGVQHVRDLGGRAVEVQKQRTGVTVLEGTIPDPRP